MLPRVIRQVLLLLVAATVAIGAGNAAVASNAMSPSFAMPADAAVSDASSKVCQPGLAEPCTEQARACAALCAAPTIDLPRTIPVSFPVTVLRSGVALSLREAAGIARRPILPPPRPFFI